MVGTDCERPTPAREPVPLVVVSPMHVMTLSARRSWGVRMAQRLHAVSQRWFTHVLLLFLLAAYAALGALAFRCLEGPYEARAKTGLRQVRRLLVDELRRSCSSTDEHRWRRLALRRLQEYEAQMRALCQAGVTTDAERQLWTFWGAMFYCGTVFTTIGYGNIAPSTTTGRAATIAYALFGIPLLLMVLADLGKLFTRLIKLAFTAIRRFYNTKNMRSLRRASRRATEAPGQILVAWRTTASYPSRKRIRRARLRTEVVDEAAVEARVPVSLVLLFLLAYMTLGALMFSLWEGWSFFEAFYFVFVSMSTIGFGDYVPQQPAFMMAAFVYLLFGLALTSMCITVIQEKLAATFEKAQAQIGVSLGLDDANGLLGGAYVESAHNEPILNPQPV
ncbi:TWiK family of potassium channels protein 18 [Rhipicephalus sanguineus]|uniref:TWiK family of potassium channels protein 18 n=1 Tax=Rhipicephalus sanguineus TaxID=34632 RepID=UPI0020C38AB2|nr:TWiK family of potassium channels protein 18 [Rhipicephalus sanguineus]